MRGKPIQGVYKIQVVLATWHSGTIASATTMRSLMTVPTQAQYHYSSSHGATQRHADNNTEEAQQLSKRRALYETIQIKLANISCPHKTFIFMIK